MSDTAAFRKALQSHLWRLPDNDLTALEAEIAAERIRRRNAAKIAAGIIKAGQRRVKSERARMFDPHPKRRN